MYIVYIITIHLSISPINRDYSRLLFSFITYFSNNMGEHCIFLIYQHKGKCDSLRILLMLFCLSYHLPPDPHLVDCLRILHTSCVVTTKTYTVPLDSHIVYCLNIYNTFFVLTTDKPRLFTVVVFFYHTFFQQFGQTLRLRDQLTQRQVQFIEDFITAILFILSFTAGPSHNVITFAPILLASCFRKPIDCWFIWN